MCNQLDDVRTRLLIAGGLMVAALVAVGIALALNGNPWTSAFGGAAAAGAIALGLLLGTIAAVVATQSALYDWYRCMTVRSGPVCHTQWLVALAALTAILAALAFQAAQVGSAIPISFIPGFAAPVLTVVLVGLGVQAAALATFGFSFDSLVRCIAEHNGGSTTSPLAARRSGSGGRGSGGGTGTGSGRRLRVPDLEALLTSRRWIRDPVHGIWLPLPLDPENCPACTIVLALEGEITDVAGGRGGKVTGLAVHPGDVAAFAIDGTPTDPPVPAGQSPERGEFSAVPGLSVIEEGGLVIRGAVLDGASLRAVIVSEPGDAWTAQVKGLLSVSEADARR